MKVKILGLGHALPDKILSNKDLEMMVDTSDEWIKERTGISERRIGEKDITTSDLCEKAAHHALLKAGVKPEELGLIVVATVTPDMLFPSTSCIVQDKLGAYNAAAFDLGAGCTGFVYALSMAEKFLLASTHKYALVIGADMLSRITDYTDRSTCILFGDGAGAAVLGKEEGECGIIATYLGADGGGAGLLYMPAGGAKLPPSEETVKNRLHYIKMNGNEVFRFATRIMGTVSDKLIKMAGITYEEIDYFVPHQANIRIIQTAMKKMDIGEEKTIINLERLGNMSAASVPVAMSEADEAGKFKEGDLILTVAFGAGLTFGGALIKWGRG
ncbi:3-oxoacyl-[acyl-carrier-protein] synthase III [Thermosyntropha lipolytica DSM 11003]|uniref:Beta-ketoacyl-[acyl-carrier-protein] synthase III n=1 Tax=Thermosyntropha lipolytica DSM 11003 TaxID=1123382 RepID=A0A1M5JE37_9FIRM|nr:beta-ketoacyl-ACP synthase III [Thermosyntropha lipolytica]SHG38625.1 3-oxoacyl-[acyl-carrier-protein] synthase III [Thermosyntropha lipolytica DSM 11003]